MPHGASALRSDPDELLTGRELRRLTARAAAARADAGPGEIVVDVAYAVVSVALATGWVVGLASMLRSTLATAAPAGGPPVLGGLFSADAADDVDGGAVGGRGCC